LSEEESSVSIRIKYAEGDGEMSRIITGEVMLALALKVKKTSNIITIGLLAFIAYTISQWQHSMSIDNFINVVILMMIMMLNMRTYLIYINLRSPVAEEKLDLVYRSGKREYYQLLRLSLWMSVILIAAKLVSS